jgi:hypothetical protein
MTEAAASGLQDTSGSASHPAAERSAGGLEKVVEHAVVVAGWFEETANKVAGGVANAVGGLLGGSSSSSGRAPSPADAPPPVVPPAVPAPAAPVPAGGPSSPLGVSFSGGSGHSGHDHDLPLEELAILVAFSIALLQGGNLRSLSGSLLGPHSALRPAIERPG